MRQLTALSRSGKPVVPSELDASVNEVDRRVDVTSSHPSCPSHRTLEAGHAMRKAMFSLTPLLQHPSMNYVWLQDVWRSAVAEQPPRHDGINIDSPGQLDGSEDLTSLT
jgi:hypothetical protein